MLIQIKERRTDRILYSGEHESFKKAVVAAIKAKVSLANSNLSKTDLSQTDLSETDLSNIDLSGCNLNSACLRGANLSRTNLYVAILTGADLSQTKLLNTIMLGANLSMANLFEADLRGCYLSETNLSGANLSGAKLDPIVIARTSICPEGDIIGWKKIREGICKLLIPTTAKRSNATGRLCRAEFATILELPKGCAEGHSLYDREFIYRVGETVRPTEPFCEDRWQESAAGIHFYITREEAKSYSDYSI